MTLVARPARIARAGLVLVAWSTLAGGCAKTQARVVSVEPPPPLEVPAPPPRIVVPTDPTPVEPPEEVPAPVAPARPRPSRPAQPRPDPRTEPPKPAEQADATKPNGGSAEPPATTPAPTLEMQPGDRGDAGVRQLLSKAAGDLQRVDYAGLSNDLKAQYDTAKRFITLGEQALKEQNVIFAATLADKAGAIATLLLRR
jgi:outer membrane biosynthesis protein TonB